MPDKTSPVKSPLINGLRKFVLIIKDLGFCVTTITISQDFEDRLLLDLRSSVPDAKRITSIEKIPITISPQDKDVIAITTEHKSFAAHIYIPKIDDEDADKKEVKH